MEVLTDLITMELNKILRHAFDICMKILLRDGETDQITTNMRWAIIDSIRVWQLQNVCALIHSKNYLRSEQEKDEFWKAIVFSLFDCQEYDEDELLPYDELPPYIDYYKRFLLEGADEMELDSGQKELASDICLGITGNENKVKHVEFVLFYFNLNTSAITAIFFSDHETTEFFINKRDGIIKRFNSL